MQHIRKLFLPIGLLCVLASCSEPEPDPVYHSLRYVVSVDSLLSLQSAGNSIVPIDIRTKTDFKEGHISGAVSITRKQMEAKTFAYKGMAASRDSMALLLSELGIKSSDYLVLYDAKGGSDAARLWFLLFSYGHRNMALLDGGFKAWQAKQLPLEKSASTKEAQLFVFQEQDRPTMFIGRDEVEYLLNDSNTVLVDTRTFDEYSGKRQKAGAAANGRIPGSVLYDWGNSVEMQVDASFKSAKDLTYMLDSLGVVPEKNIVVWL